MGTHPIFESDFDCLTECVCVDESDIGSFSDQSEWRKTAGHQPDRWNIPYRPDNDKGSGTESGGGACSFPSPAHARRRQMWGWSGRRSRFLLAVDEFQLQIDPLVERNVEKALRPARFASARKVERK